MDEVSSPMVSYQPFQSSLGEFRFHSSGSSRCLVRLQIYNLLLGRNWFYAMTVVASTVFRTVQFLHLGRIVTIDQLNFCTSDVTTPMANNIPILGQSPPPYHSIRVGMLKDSSLMGIFPSNPPNIEMATANMIS